MSSGFIIACHPAVINHRETRLGLEANQRIMMIVPMSAKELSQHQNHCFSVCVFVQYICVCVCVCVWVGGGVGGIVLRE